MKLALVVATLTLAVLALPVSPTLAVPGPGCLAAPLPSGPGGNQSFSIDVQDGADRMRVTLWRQHCQDSEDLVLLLRVTPISAAPFVCGNRWYLEQDASEFYVTFLSAITDSAGMGTTFCDRISGPTTVIVTPADLSSGEPGTFDDEDDFGLTFYGSVVGPYVVFRIDMPYAGPPWPTIAVVPTGCNPCHSGQTVGIDGNVDNPGPAMQAEIKTAARLADGSLVSLVNKVVTLASGASVLTLVPPRALPAGLTTMDVSIEAAILEPALGVTLSRHKVILHLLP